MELSMSCNDKYNGLIQHELLNQIDSAERAQIIALCMERRFKDGQVVFQRGDPGNSMLLVLEGQVKISILSPEGKELIFNIIQPGECFGEIALLDGQPRSADATAVGKCILLMLMRKDFLPFLEHQPRVAISLMTLLCGRLRILSTFTERLAFENLPTRLACLLVKLAEMHGVATPTGMRIANKLSQKEIGGLVGTSRESVNKQLQAWQAEGLLLVERGYIALLQLEALKRLGNC
jgi:CRP-like cAMP-binding protein